MSSCLTSSIPATSVNFVFTSALVLRIHALKLKGIPHHILDPIILIKRTINSTKNKRGTICSRKTFSKNPLLLYITVTGVVSDHVSVNHNSLSEVSAGLVVVTRLYLVSTLIPRALIRKLETDHVAVVSYHSSVIPSLRSTLENVFC